MVLDFNPQIEKFYSEDTALQKRLDKGLLAGDYSDSNTKFRLVVSPPTENYDKYTFYVMPYGFDSLYGAGRSISMISVSYGSIIVGVGKRKFQASLQAGNKTMKIEDITERDPVLPDIMLFENKLPNIKFPLLYGGSKSLISFEHQHKFIYLYFWGDDQFCPHCQNEFDTLNDVYNTYKNIVSIVSFYNPEDYEKKFDTVTVKKVISDRHLEWMQGICTLELANNLFMNNFHQGILFDEDGNVIKMFILPKELGAYLKRKGFK